MGAEGRAGPETAQEMQHQMSGQWAVGRSREHNGLGTHEKWGGSPEEIVTYLLGLMGQTDHLWASQTESRDCPDPCVQRIHESSWEGSRTRPVVVQDGQEMHSRGPTHSCSPRGSMAQGMASVHPSELPFPGLQRVKLRNEERLAGPRD